MVRHSEDDQHDALNDLLDAYAGVPPAASRASELDPDTRDAVERFLDLADRAGATPAAHPPQRRPAVNATLRTPRTLPSALPARRTAGSTHRLPAWTRHMHVLSTGLLLLAVAALALATFGPGGPGRGSFGNDDGPGQFAAAPVATVPDDAVTSAIPYPDASVCTVEPMTREEIIARIQEANVATDPERPRYEHPIEPTAEQVEDILTTYDAWRACRLDTPTTSMGHSLRLESTWYSASSLGVFLNYDEGRIDRPVSETEIEAYVDAILAEEAGVAATPSDATAVEGTPVVGPGSGSADLLPIPDGATPVAQEGGGRAFPTIFAEDIVITGPDTASAPAVFVDEQTREVVQGTPIMFGFVNVDGQWLIDSYREGGLG